MLAKRLINVQSISEFLEGKIHNTFPAHTLPQHFFGVLFTFLGQMISKLKHTCDFDYTSKLVRMFNDIAISKELLEEFRRSTKDAGKSTMHFKTTQTRRIPSETSLAFSNTLS